MQFLSSHGAAEDVCRGWLLTMAAEAAEDGCSSKGSSSFKCSLFLRGIGLAGQDGALPSSFVLLGCPNHGKIFSSRRATPRHFVLVRRSLTRAFRAPAEGLTASCQTPTFASRFRIFLGWTPTRFKQLLRLLYKGCSSKHPGQKHRRCFPALQR